MSATRNLRESLQVARQLGCAITHPRGTGELRVTHPLVPGRVLLNRRRKDEPRVLRVLVRKAQRVSPPAEPVVIDHGDRYAARAALSEARALWQSPGLPAPRWRLVLHQLEATGHALGYENVETLLQREVHPDAVRFLEHIDHGGRT